MQWLTRHLLKMVTEDDIIRITSDGYLLNGRKLPPEVVSSLKAEAREIKESELWKYMCNELEYVAFVRGRKSTTDMDNYATHSMFYNLDLLNQFLNNLAK